MAPVAPACAGRTVLKKHYLLVPARDRAYRFLGRNLECAGVTFVRACRQCLGAVFLVLSGTAAAAPSFSAVDRRAAGRRPGGAVVLHSGWQMRESAIVGDEGGFSQAGFQAADWYETSVPTTALAAGPPRRLSRPVIGTNNMRDPRCQRRPQPPLRPDRFSHLPDKANLEPSRIGFARNSACRGYAARWSGCTWTGSTIAPTYGSTGATWPMRNRWSGCFAVSASTFVVPPPTGLNALAVCIHPLDFPGDPVHEQLEGCRAASPLRRRRRDPPQRHPVLQHRLGLGAARDAIATWGSGNTSGWRRPARWRSAIRRL